MANILETIASYARERVAEAKKYISDEQMRSLALKLPMEDFPFEKALSKEGLSLICECKKASPSKGLIEPDFDYISIARAYEAAGADCISVLTEPKWFLGSSEYLSRIAAEVKTPCIRKDFVVDDYMIYEAKILGAKAVLLICAITEKTVLKDRIALCDSLGLTALVEAHDEEEIEAALDCGARVIGVNNRNLKDFSVDFSNSMNLKAQVPEGIIFVAESGVSKPEDVKPLIAVGVDAVLIGEAIMRAPDKAAFINAIRKLS